MYVIEKNVMDLNSRNKTIYDKVCFSFIIDLFQGLRGNISLREQFHIIKYMSGNSCFINQATPTTLFSYCQGECTTIKKNRSKKDSKINKTK